MAEKVEKKHTNLEDTFSITMELQRPLLKDEDDENEEEVYTGNMFSNFEEQLKELDKNKKD